MKDEKQAIKEFVRPVLKDQYFVKLSVRVDRLHQKLTTEGLLSPEELSIKHPFNPDIDVLFWSKQYSGEPILTGSEVKYFRLRNGTVYPTIYEGLGEAMMLLTFGLDYVCLWHFFDPEIPTEIVNRYRELTQNMISDTTIPLNYQSWVLPNTSNFPEFQITMTRLTYFLAMTVNVKQNPLRYRWDTKIIRSIIKKGYRIINK